MELSSRSAEATRRIAYEDLELNKFKLASGVHWRTGPDSAGEGWAPAHQFFVAGRAGPGRATRFFNLLMVVLGC